MSKIKIEITAGGIYGADGEVPIGTTFDLDEEPKGWGGRYRVVGETKGKAAVTNPEKFTTKVDGDKIVILDGKGKPVGKPLNLADGKAFDEMSPDDQAAFAAEHAKA